MGRFSENDLQIFDPYLPNDLRTRFVAFVNSLAVAGIPDAAEILRRTNVPVLDAQKQQLASAVVMARQALLDFLSRSGFDEGSRLPVNGGDLSLLRKTLQSVKTRDFAAVRDACAGPPPEPTSPPPERTLRDAEAKFPTPLPAFETLVTAFHAEAIDYIDYEMVFDREDDPEPRMTIQVGKTLAGAPADARPSEAELREVYRCFEFLTRGTFERHYRLDLIANECVFELAATDDQLAQVIGVYANLRDRDPARVTERKLVALRQAAAQLALADRGYRRARAPSPGERDMLLAAYAAAAALVARPDLAIDAANPLRIAIEQSVAHQQAKLNAGFNALGFVESYVPPYEADALRGLVDAHLGLFESAVAKFKAFKEQAQALTDQIRSDILTGDIATMTAKIDAEKLAKATARVEISKNDALAIQNEIDSRSWGFDMNIGMMLVKGAAAALKPGSLSQLAALGTMPGFLNATHGALGIAKGLMEYGSRKESLAIQKRNAELQQRIAGRDVEIARTEQAITNAHLAYITEKLQTEVGAELGPELHYAVAETYRRLAERHYEAAIWWAFLFERAAAFQVFATSPPIVRLDYLDQDASAPAHAPRSSHLFTTGARLRAALAEVDALKVQGRMTVALDPYYLYVEHPLELAALQQEGRARFCITLPRLGRSRPDLERMRITHVGVQIGGLNSPQGWRGTLRHLGNFMVRDRASTVGDGTAAATRLIPTETEMQAAFDRVNSGEQSAPVGGVIPYWLPASAISIGSNDTMPSTMMPDLVPNALTGIEGYGPAGWWELVIHRDGNLNFANIDEVIIHFRCLAPEPDAALGAKVEELRAGYEQELAGAHALDEILPVQMRVRFPEQLATLVRTGTADVTMRRADFRPNIRDLKLKWIVAQVVDREGRGIAGIDLVITREGTSLEIMKTTNEGGFTEALDAPIPELPVAQRFDVEGTYRLRAVEPSRLGADGDVLLFFVYDYGA